jgi:hypothetical protein
VLCHETKILVPKNEKTNLQKATLEITKHPIGMPKLQSQLTLQSLGKQIKQESDEKINSQRPKKKRSTYTQWFHPQL